MAKACVGGYIAALFMNCPGAPSGVRVWIGRVVDIIDRSGSRPKRLDRAIELEHLTCHHYFRCNWLIPARTENEKEFEEATYKLEPHAMRTDNLDELKAEFIINCPVMTPDETSGTFTVRAVDLKYILEWLQKTRDALDDGSLGNNKSYVKKNTSGVRSKGIKRAREDFIDAEKIAEDSEPVVARSGRTSKKKRKRD